MRGAGDCRFADLLRLVKQGDVWVLNDTRVIRRACSVSKESGGRVEVLVERVLNEHEVLAQVRASKSPKAGSRLLLERRFCRLRCWGARGSSSSAFTSDEPVLGVAGALWPITVAALHHPCCGRRRRAALSDGIRTRSGAVAAPTAGLHFDEAMLEPCAIKGSIFLFTLHVGARNISAVRVEYIHEQPCIANAMRFRPLLLMR